MAEPRKKGKYEQFNGLSQDCKKEITDKYFVQRFEFHIRHKKSNQTVTGYVLI